MLLLDQRTLQIKYRVPASEIYRLSLSPFLDDVAVFHVRAVRKCVFLVLFEINLMWLFFAVGGEPEEGRLCVSNLPCD